VAPDWSRSENFTPASRTQKIPLLPKFGDFKKGVADGWFPKPHAFSKSGFLSWLSRTARGAPPEKCIIPFTVADCVRNRVSHNTVNCVLYSAKERNIDDLFGDDSADRRKLAIGFAVASFDAASLWPKEITRRE
jgi:hypothetical protein